MTGDQFLDALRKKVTPRVIENLWGDSAGIIATLDDGSKIEFERARVKSISTDAELSEYLAEIMD